MTWVGSGPNRELICQKSFCQQINRQYAYNILEEQAEELDLIWEEEREDMNGNLVIILSGRGEKTNRGEQMTMTFIGTV